MALVLTTVMAPPRRLMKLPKAALRAPGPSVVNPGFHEKAISSDEGADRCQPLVVIWDCRGRHQRIDRPRDLHTHMMPCAQCSMATDSPVGLLRAELVATSGLPGTEPPAVPMWLGLGRFGS